MNDITTQILRQQLQEAEALQRREKINVRNATEALDIAVERLAAAEATVAALKETLNG